MEYSEYKKKFTLAAHEAGYSQELITKCLNFAEPLLSQGFPIIYTSNHLLHL